MIDLLHFSTTVKLSQHRKVSRNDCLTRHNMLALPQKWKSTEAIRVCLRATGRMRAVRCSGFGFCRTRTSRSCSRTAWNSTCYHSTSEETGNSRQAFNVRFVELPYSQRSIDNNYSATKSICQCLFLWCENLFLSLISLIFTHFQRYFCSTVYYLFIVFLYTRYYRITLNSFHVEISSLLHIALHY